MFSCDLSWQVCGEVNVWLSQLTHADDEDEDEDDDGDGDGDGDDEDEDDDDDDDDNEDDGRRLVGQIWLSDCHLGLHDNRPGNRKLCLNINIVIKAKIESILFILKSIDQSQAVLLVD